MASFTCLTERLRRALATTPLARLLAAALLLSATTVSGAGSWQLSRHDAVRNITVYVRDIPGSSYRGFYAVTQVRATTAAMLSVLADVPAMPEWIVRMSHARLLKRDADREAWIYGRYRMPYPFLDREAVLHSQISQDANTGVVVVTSRAVGGYVPPAAHTVRLTRMESTWRLTPLADGMLRVELWGQGDPGGYVPPVLFNYNLPDEPAQTFRNLRHMLARDKYLKPVVRK